MYRVEFKIDRDAGAQYGQVTMSWYKKGSARPEITRRYTFPGILIENIAEIIDAAMRDPESDGQQVADMLAFIEDDYRRNPLGSMRLPAPPPYSSGRHILI